MADPASHSSGDVLADRRYDYAMAAKAEGDHAATADLLTQALEIAPCWAAGWFALGEAEAARGERESAIAAFTKAVDLAPGDPFGARLALARLGAGDADGAMTPAYVAAVFDQYAPRFDATLREKLAYRGPEILKEAVGRACAGAQRPFRFDHALDLGCGTGLAAETFAPHVDAIDGVDLSSRMIDIARRKNLYRELVVDDLSAFLSGRPAASADLILAADVFVYCADLQPIIAAARRILVPGGLLAFTVETHDGDGVVLGAGLRYAHGERLVRRLFADGEWNLAILDRVSTRNEADRPVPGLAAIAVNE